VTRRARPGAAAAAKDVSFAVRLIFVAARAFDTGQPFLAPSAISWNFALSMPGTSASVVRSMAVIPNPPSTCSRWTPAVVLTRRGVKPARPRAAERAMEKQPAWAAPISSSGFVPVPCSKRELKEYAPWNAPLPSDIVPLPSLSVPSHCAFAERTGMLVSFRWPW